MAPDFIIINADIVCRKWNSFKKFQSIPKFTIFEILKLFEYSFLFHIPSLLIHSTSTKSKIAESCQRFIGNILVVKKDAKKISNENFWSIRSFFFVSKK